MHYVIDLQFLLLLSKSCFFSGNLVKYKTTSGAEFSRKLDKEGSINKCEAQQILGSDKQTLSKIEYQLILSEVLKFPNFLPWENLTLILTLRDLIITIFLNL